MKIVILDGYTENPGDLTWEGFEQLRRLIRGGAVIYFKLGQLFKSFPG